MSSYSDLMAVIDPSNYDDSEDEIAAQNAMTALDNCATWAQNIVDSLRNGYEPAITGALQSAVSNWVADYVRRITEHKEGLSTATTHYDAARTAMTTAASQAQSLASDADITNNCEWLTLEPEVVVEGVSYTGKAYAAKLKSQYMEERERLAQEYLDAMNSTMAEHAALKPIPDSSEGAPDMGGGGIHTMGGGSGAYPGGGGAAYSSGGAAVHGSASAGAVSAGSVAPTPGLSASGAIPFGAAAPGSLGSAILTNRERLLDALPPSAASWLRPEAGSPGSRGNPITDPERLSHLDLLKTPVNQRMTSDGPVGGYVPPPVADAFHPGWRTGPGFSTTATGHGGGSAASIAMAGGVIGTGAAALARGGASGLSGLIPAGGAAALAGQVPGTGMLSAMTGATGMYPGMVGAGYGAPGTSATGARGAGPIRGAAMGGIGPAGSERREKKDKKRRRRPAGYDVPHPDDEAAVGTTESASTGAGTANALAPLAAKEEDDRW